MKIRTLLLEKQAHQSKVHTGEKGWTCLHYAAYKGDLGVVKDIIRYCADCAEEIDNEGRNFFHVAIKNVNFGVVNYVM